jgi:hypothetical protein
MWKFRKTQEFCECSTLIFAVSELFPSQRAQKCCNSLQNELLDVQKFDDAAEKQEENQESPGFAAESKHALRCKTRL